jgi:hypothetical protein
MQEKLCSSHLEYLVPIGFSDTYNIPSRYHTLIVGDDLTVDVHESVANHDMMTSPEPGLLTAYQLLGKWVCASRTRDELVRNIEFTLYDMGPRKNTITSDRLAILANACNLNLTLDTTALRDQNFSYRTCLLVLTFANVWPDIAEGCPRYRLWAMHEMGQDTSAITEMADDILEEFMIRPRIVTDMKWVHYDSNS